MPGAGGMGPGPGWPAPRPPRPACQWGRGVAGAALCSPNSGASGHRPGIFQEDRVRIAGARQHGESAGTGAAAGTAEQPPLNAGARRSARRRRMWITLSLVAVLLVGVNAYATYVLVSQHNARAGANLRPSGIPENISTSTANLMELSPVPGVRAPGFRFTDQ